MGDGVYSKEQGASYAVHTIKQCPFVCVQHSQTVVIQLQDHFEILQSISHHTTAMHVQQSVSRMPSHLPYVYRSTNSLPSKLLSQLL